mgnify:CR=1 FL=1
MTTPETPIITYEILTGYCTDTMQEFHLVVFRHDHGRIKRAQLRMRNTPDSDWSEPLELKHLPPADVHPSIA